ncbi:MAG: class I SAM-dependent methyltransferase [Dehalococcoidia bacterium]|nr:class I SAM-dependent methyltransferase [Dehalococcoidia bacterium]
MSINIDEILDEGLQYHGVHFASKPAALRQLVLVRDILDALPEGDWVTGVDIGSKYDDLGQMLKAHNVRCTRVDIENRPGDGEFVLGDGESLPFADNSVGFAVLSHVMAHVEHLDRMMSEVARILIPGGRVFILQSNRYGWWKFWGYYLRRNDRVVHWRTIDAWGMQHWLADAGLGIEKMYAPYHFYLHSKLSGFFYKLDRVLERRVPKAIATQWLVRAKKPDKDLPFPSRKRSLTLPEKATLIVIATLQAVGIKALELALRLLKGGKSVAEQT